MKINLYLILLASALLCVGQGSFENGRQIAPAQLQQDFDLFRTVLLEAHPKINRVYDDYTFQSRLSGYRTLLADSMTGFRFFQIVSSAMSDIGEAHSHVDISEEMKSQIEQSVQLLPFNIHFFDNRAFVSKDLTAEPTKLEGMEIFKINGKSIDKIIHIIDSISCIGSGKNRSRILRKLSYERNFALSYHLYVDQSQSFLVEYRKSKEDVEKATVVEGIPANFEVTTIQSPAETTPPFSFSIDLEKSLAVLRIKTFAHFIIGYKQKEYLKFYQECFKKIADANLSNLVIDVRGNRGGQERLGAELLAYVIEDRFPVQRSVFTKELEYELLDSLGILHHWFDPKKFTAVDSGYVVTNPKHDVLSIINPVKKNRFNGNLYILADGNCFSACNIFVSLADYHNAAKIIGEETGGNYHDTDGYPGVIFKLPNSGLGINFRLWHLRTAVENDLYGRGVLPDIPVQATIDNILSGKDAAMEKVYELIQQSKSQ